MRKLFAALLIAIALTQVSCTEQERARQFGGSITIEVEPGQKVMMATWKGDDLFYMVEPMEKDYAPKTKKLIESSSWGVLESEIVFKESK